MRSFHRPPLKGQEAVPTVGDLYYPIRSFHRPRGEGVGLPGSGWRPSMEIGSRKLKSGSQRSQEVPNFVTKVKKGSVVASESLNPSKDAVPRAGSPGLWENRRLSMPSGAGRRRGMASGTCRRSCCRHHAKVGLWSAPSFHHGHRSTSPPGRGCPLRYRERRAERDRM